MMKKQLLRVKQLADQTFSRADKTQVLTDDLQDADRRVEYIRVACQKTSKLMSSGLVTQGQDPAAKEKRLKKYPEYALSVAMSESVSSVTCDSLLRGVLSKCGHAQLALANEAFGFELNVEQKVVAMLAEVVENEVPSIMKHKHRLQKLILDMDSARTRLATASKQSGGQRGEAIREELEEAELKVEQCRDALASEMFELVSREADFAQAIVLHAKLQQEYHRSALQVLDELIPELETDVQDSPCKPVFHFPLEEHLRVTNRRIAFPLELCVCALLRLATQEEGLFRVAGGSSKVRRLKLSLDAGCLDLAAAIEYGDPHVLAAALKSYLRELPEPLATFTLYPLWMLAAKETEQEPRLNALWAVLHQLPTANFENLRYLIKFLAELTKSQAVNKMSPQNIAIVIAPNLFWSPGEESASIGANMNMASAYTSIVDTLISFCDWFFPEPVTFYQTWDEPKDVSVRPVNGSSLRITAQDDFDYYGHVRGGSNDTVLVQLEEQHAFARAPSTGSLSDSPPHGSPKPATRRKNKPAPGPPPTAPPPRPTPASTLPRPPKKPLETMETKPLERNSNLRRSLDLLRDNDLLEGRKQGVDTSKRDGMGVDPTDTTTPIVLDVSKKSTQEAKKEFVESRGTRDMEAKGVSEHTEPGHVARVTVNAEPATSVASVGKPNAVNTSTLDRKRPVAAPRCAPNSEEEVTLRRPIDTDRPKPAIPERPTILQRPPSLNRTPRHSAEMDALPDAATLERIHMYCVDKQQVSIVHVGTDRDEKTASEDTQTDPRPARPDTASHESTPPSPGARPPRPQPPPPPAKPRPESDSTDL